MNVRRILLSLFLCLTVLEAIGIAESQSTSSLPAVACHFESSVKSQGQDLPDQRAEWYFWREAERIETRATTGETSEIWQKDQGGNVFYQLVFHENRLVVDYLPDQLRAAQYVPEWSELAMIIAPDLLTMRLQETGEVEVVGRQAKRYQGQVNEVVVEVWWLEAERIPALVRQVYPDGEMTLRLIALYPVDQSPWTRSQLAHYKHLDVADLDDTESASLALQNGDAVTSRVIP